MQWLLVVAGLLLLVVFALYQFTRANPATTARALRHVAIGAVVLTGLLLIMIGRLPWQLAIAMMLVPIVSALLLRGRGPGAERTRTAGKRSEVTTRYLRMVLHHDTGVVDGTVVEGAFAGRTLSSMSLEELRSLVGEISADADSLNVLAAYLDRAHGESWRETASRAGGERAASPTSAMTRDEAYRVLGLAPGASDSEIRAAHRRLMKLAHPDHGGSDYLASKINEAKDLLLGTPGARQSK